VAKDRGLLSEMKGERKGGRYESSWQKGVSMISLNNRDEMHPLGIEAVEKLGEEQFIRGCLCGGEMI